MTWITPRRSEGECGGCRLRSSPVEIGPLWRSAAARRSVGASALVGGRQPKDDIAIAFASVAQGAQPIEHIAIESDENSRKSFCIVAKNLSVLRGTMRRLLLHPPSAPIRPRETPTRAGFSLSQLIAWSRLRGLPRSAHCAYRAELSRLRLTKRPPPRDFGWQANLRRGGLLATPRRRPVLRHPWSYDHAVLFHLAADISWTSTNSPDPSDEEAITKAHALFSEREPLFEGFELWDRTRMLIGDPQLSASNNAPESGSLHRP